MRCWHERSLGVLILCIAGLLASSARGEQRRAPRDLGLDVVLLLDSSPSTKTTDPQNHRVTAAHFLLDYLEATSELLRVNHWAAFANFGGRIGAAVPLQLVGGGRVHEKLQAETIPYTDFRPALEFALRELRPVSTGTGRQAIVVLFTDGLPELDSGALKGPELARYFAGEPLSGDSVGLQLSRQVANLGELGGELFVVAVGGNQEAEAGWKSLIPASHYLALQTTTQLAEAYHQIFSEKLGFEGVEQYNVEVGKPVSIPMEPLVEQVIFSFIKEDVEADPDLTDPHGQHPRRISGGKTGDLHEVFETTRPASGANWTAEVTGGSAHLFVAQRRPPLEVTEPFTPQPAGVPLALIASLGEGAEPLDGLRITATIDGPGFEEPVAQELDALEDGRFRLVTPPATARGTYHVQLEAHFDGEDSASLVRDLEIEVEPVPEIASVEVVEVEDEWRVEVLVRNADQLELGSVLWSIANQTQHPLARSPVSMQSGKQRSSHSGTVVFEGQLPAKSLPSPELGELTMSGATPDGLHFLSSRVLLHQDRTAAPVRNLQDLARVLAVLAAGAVATLLAQVIRRNRHPLLAIGGVDTEEGITATVSEITEILEPGNQLLESDDLDGAVLVCWLKSVRRIVDKLSKENPAEAIQILSAQFKCERLAAQKSAARTLFTYLNSEGPSPHNSVEIFYGVLREVGASRLRAFLSMQNLEVAP